VYLPFAATSQATVVPSKDIQPVRGGSETILLAEDHEGLREIARETLEAMGYSVLTVCDGEAAIAEFDKHRSQVDLLLFDVELPKLSGLKAYALICSCDPEVPVIFATGYSADVEMLLEIRRKKIMVLQKPYIPRDLARAVRETLDQYSAKMKST
jgi:two-component system cell cycle sensor histidine kinase/response regulator CckA